MATVRGSLLIHTAIKNGVPKNSDEDWKKQRLEKLKQFRPGNTVTNGVQQARVKSIDTTRCSLIVGILPSGREAQWSPDNVEKVK